MIVAKPGDQQGRGPQGQDARLRPRRRRRLRRGRDRAARASSSMQVGRDYKVISVPGRAGADRGAGQRRHRRALVSVPRALQAVQAGMKVLLRTGDYMPRAGGTFWATEEYLREEPRDGEEVHPRHRQGRDVLPRQQGGLARHAEGAPRRRRATRRPALIWDELHNTFARRTAEGSVPRDLRVAPARHDRREAVAGGQAAARSGAVPGARPARVDAEGR